MPHRNGLRIAVLLAALAGALPAVGTAAGVYKWTDAKGVVHYDDQNMMNGTQVTRADVQRSTVKPTPDWSGVVPVEFARNVEANCALARERLQNYRSAGRLYQRDARGNTQALSPAQAQKMIADTQRDAGRLCAPDAARVMYQQRLRHAEQKTASLR